jgi:hypothetical protein
MKKSKVKKITKMEKKDSYGNTSFIVELENGDKGFYSSKNEDQKKFVPGQEAEYNIEEKEGREGKKYFKITIPQEPGKSFGGGGRPSPIDPKIQMISFAMSYTKDLIVSGKIGIQDLGTQFEVIYNEMISKI